MSKIFGLVAEFNPFHNGHKALIAEARRAGHTHCVAVMSGNFVQRGEAAVAEKRVRARAALLEGVDLILDLPVPYATATAQRFALGAVSLLQGTGCVETLCFGSECGDLTLLQDLADAVDDPSLPLSGYLGQGMTYARARSLALADRVGEEKARHLSTANNLLAVEYIRAAKALGWNPGYFTMERLGTAHDSASPSRKYASASYLRKHAEDAALWKRYLPKQGFAVLERARADGFFPLQRERLEWMMLAHLRRLGQQDLRRLPDLSEGIEQRLYHAIRASHSLEEILWNVKTKRYTLARVRRLVLHAYLGLTAEDAAIPPPYLRVLGFNGRGREILGEMKATAMLPVNPSLMRLRDSGEHCARFADMEALATDLYTAALPTPVRCGYEYSASGIYLPPMQSPQE